MAIIEEIVNALEGLKDSTNDNGKKTLTYLQTEVRKLREPEPVLPGLPPKDEKWEKLVTVPEDPAEEAPAHYKAPVKVAKKKK